MVKNKKIHIGRIHAEWCGHCKSLKEPWKIMKEMISLNMDNDLKHHHVHYHDFEDKNDQSEDYNKKIDDFNNLYLSESPNKVSIQGGFPTLFRVLNGKLTYYNGNRDAKSMYDWYTLGINKKGGSKYKKSKKRKTNNKKRSIRSTRRKRNSFFGLRF